MSSQQDISCGLEGNLQHSPGEKEAGSEALEQDVGDRVEGVSNEENRERHVVLRIRHMQVLLETFDLRIANVGSIQEAGLSRQIMSGRAPKVKTVLT